MGPLGMGEIVVLFVLALLIFGPKKLPELGRTFGKGMAEFKRASSELKTTFRREMDNIERETTDVKSAASEVRQEINTSYYDNEDEYYNDYDYGEGGSGSDAYGSSAKAGKKPAGDSSPQASDEAGAASVSTGDSPSPETGEEPGAAAPAVSVSGLPEGEQTDTTKPA